MANAQDKPNKVRVAAISFEPVKLDLQGNSQRLEAWFRKAAAGGAKIAVAPEGALDGYVVNEIIATEIAADEMRKVAIATDSLTMQRFQGLAKELDLCLVFGFAERDGNDVFNTAVFIDNTGTLCGKYRKMQFHEGYDSSWWFNRLGESSRAFDTPYGRCGVMICNDRWNPLLAKIPALDGAQFLVIPSFGSTSTSQDEAVLARGRENQLPVVEANVGVSLIISEDQIASVQRKREGIVFGEISIPPARARNISLRDQMETEFLAWRAQEMPKRLNKFMANLDPRAEAREQDVVTLKTSQLTAIVGNNRSYRPGNHRAGYNGLFSVRSTQNETQESPFVSAYAGWNLEHYFDGRIRTKREQFFEPRFAPLHVRKVDEETVELYQPTTSEFQVESWTRFQAVEPDAINFSFRCKPHRDDYVGDFLGVFWASYINAPLNKSIYFLDGESTLEKPVWRQFCTQQHNRDSTIRNVVDDGSLHFDSQNALFANESPLRYSHPIFYGRFRDMVLIYVFQQNSGIRITQSPSGGGLTPDGTDTNPAWDFQLIIPNPSKGEEYGMNGRFIYKKWRGREDVLAEVKKFLATEARANKDATVGVGR